ncbi:MAG: GNAT family N-acetyltransferase [Haliea sp.]
MADSIQSSYSVRGYCALCTAHCASIATVKDGRVIGSVFIVRQDESAAKLRLLYVDPCARGLGIGSRLVDECLRFARRAGYKRMVLWTNSVLTSARRIYDRAGFELIEENPHHSFGQDLIGQVLARDL